MKTTLKIIAIFLAMTLSQSISAARALPEFSAHYAIEKFGAKLAEAHYQLKHTSTGYKFSQDTKLHGIGRLLGNDTISAVSYIRESGNKLLLQKHTYRQTGRKKNKDADFRILWDDENPASENPASVNFDPDSLSAKRSDSKYLNSKNSKSEPSITKGKIEGIVQSKKIHLVTETPVWEALSFQIPLMLEANKDIKEYPYNALLKGEINTYNFILTEIKNIKFAEKQYQALHMTRTDPVKNRKLSIWLAPELHNLPLLVENFRDGKEHSVMRLESIKFKNENPLSEQTSFGQLHENDDDF